MNWLRIMPKTCVPIFLLCLLPAACDSSRTDKDFVDGDALRHTNMQGVVMVEPQLIRARTNSIVTVADAGSSKSLLQGARVVADQQNGAGRFETVTDENGQFSFALPPGDYLIAGEFTDEFDLASFAVSSVTDSKAISLALDLDLNGILHGKVVNAKGAGVFAKAEIALLKRYALTVSDGTFIFPTLAAGTYTLQLLTPDSGMLTTTVTVSPGSRTDVGVLVLTEPENSLHAMGNLTLYVSDAEGYPVVGATCSLMGQVSWADSNEKGQTLLPVYALPAEVYCVKPGFVSNKLFVQTLSAEAREIHLMPTRRAGAIALQVVDESLSPVSGAGVDLYTDLGVFKQLRTGADGKIKVNASGCVGADVFKSGFQSPPPFQICPPNDGKGESFYQIRLCAGSTCAKKVDLCSLASKDCDPPVTVLTTFPPLVTTDRTAEFVFAANEESTFYCRLDGLAWESCSSPKIYTHLATGLDHTFRVYAIDSQGNRQSREITYNWTLQKTGTLYVLLENATLATGLFETLSGDGYWAPPTWQTPDAVDTGNNNLGTWKVKQEKLVFDDDYLFVFNFGNVGGVQNDWLYGYAGSAPTILEKGWFRVEYADGTSKETAMTCAFMDYAYASWRGQGRLYKQHNGELRIEPEGHPVSYEGAYGACVDPW